MGNIVVSSKPVPQPTPTQIARADQEALAIIKRGSRGHESEIQSILKKYTVLDRVRFATFLKDKGYFSPGISADQRKSILVAAFLYSRTSDGAQYSPKGYIFEQYGERIIDILCLGKQTPAMRSVVIHPSPASSPPSVLASVPTQTADIEKAIRDRIRNSGAYVRVSPGRRDKDTVILQLALGLSGKDADGYYGSKTYQMLKSVIDNLKDARLPSSILGVPGAEFVMTVYQLEALAQRTGTISSEKTFPSEAFRRPPIGVRSQPQRSRVTVPVPTVRPQKPINFQFPKIVKDLAARYSRLSPHKSVTSAPRVRRSSTEGLTEWAMRTAVERHQSDTSRMKALIEDRLLVHRSFTPLHAGDVALLQWLANRISGHHCAIDGDLGPKTMMALKAAFQKVGHPLKADQPGQLLLQRYEIRFLINAL